MTPEGLERAADWLAAADQVVISTGAGMSKESGIPTFRDTQDGLWAHFDPQQLATEEGFRSAPARVWSWYQYRRARMTACLPHAGHAAIVALERAIPNVTIVTQNIDGLHQRSGSAEVIELHGSISRNRCIDCRSDFILGPEQESAAVEAEEAEPPRCADCGGFIRPGVVWFGEMLPQEAMEVAWEKAAACDVLLVIGTSGLVWPAAELPGVAKRMGGRVIEVNPEPTELTRLADVFLAGAAGEVLPRLAEAVAARRG